MKWFCLKETEKQCPIFLLCCLLIQDYLKFMNYEDFDILSAFSEFNRTYPDIPENHLFIVMNH